MELAPIVFFVYKRPDHAQRAVNSLLKNELASQSRLFIFSDGAKNEKDSLSVQETRKYIASIKGFAEVNIIEREHNVGCGINISDGITYMLNRFSKVIVFEDDLIVSPYFLQYMNDAPEIYKDDDKVSTVNAFMYPYVGRHAEKLPEYFFLPQTSSWGWGTWSRFWKDYDYDAAKLLEQITQRRLESQLNLGNSIDFMGMLRSQAYGSLDTWDIQLQAVNVLTGRLGLFPSVSLSQNLGMDGSGTHCGNVGQDSEEFSRINGSFAKRYTPLKRIPIEINSEAYDLEKHVLRDMSRKPPLIYRAVRKLRKIMNLRRKDIDTHEQISYTQPSARFAPIIFFVHKRPEHTKRTIESLLQNKLASQSRLFVFSDGAKFEQDISAVEAVRKYIRGINGFAYTEIIERERNIGLRANLSDGITQIISRYGKAIILEDDLVLSPCFLNYMNDGLELYKDDENVSSINAFMYPEVSARAKYLPPSFFLPHTSSWGWATWFRAWKDYDRAAPQELLDRIKAEGLGNKFSIDGTYDFTGMLEAQVLGKIDSWAIQWYAVNFLKGRLSLYPSVAMAGNEGFDGKGTHTGKALADSKEARRINGKLAEEYIELKRIPVEINHEALELEKNIFREMNRKPPLICRIVRKLKKMTKNLPHA